MQLALRLFYPLDADLIAIRLRERRNFTRLVREKLTRLLNSAERLSDSDLYHVPKDIQKYMRAPLKPLRVNLNLKEGRDDLLINYLSQIRITDRSDTIKILFRMCFDIYPIEYFPATVILGTIKADQKTSSTPVEAIPSKLSQHTEAAIKNKSSLKSSEHNPSDKSPIKKEDSISEKYKVTPEIKTQNKDISSSIQVDFKDNSTKETTNAHIPTYRTDSTSPKEKLIPNDNAADETAYEMFSKLLGY